MDAPVLKNDNLGQAVLSEYRHVHTHAIDLPRVSASQSNKSFVAIAIHSRRVPWTEAIAIYSRRVPWTEASGFAIAIYSRRVPWTEASGFALFWESQPGGRTC